MVVGLELFDIVLEGGNDISDEGSDRLARKGISGRVGSEGLLVGAEGAD